MRNSFSDRVNTLEAMQKVFAQYPAAVASIKALEDGVADYNKQLAAIKTLFALQSQSTTLLVTKHKNALLQQAIDHTLVIAQRLSSAAQRTNNTILIDGIFFHLTDYKKSTEQDKLMRMQAVLTRAQDNASLLADWDINPTTLTELQNSIEAFAAQAGAPGYRRMTRASYTQALTESLASTFQFVREDLTVLVQSIAQTQPAFVDMFHRFAKIQKTGRNAKNPQVQVIVPTNAMPKKAMNPVSGKLLDAAHEANVAPTELPNAPTEGRLNRISSESLNK